MLKLTSFSVARTVAIAAGAASLSVTSSADAHHSFAMFDQRRTVVSTVVVSKIEWTNPHAYLFFRVPGKTGADAQFAIECGSISLLSRKGWKFNSLRVGETVTVTYHPLRNGRNGGMLVSVAKPNGALLRG